MVLATSNAKSLSLNRTHSVSLNLSYSVLASSALSADIYLNFATFSARKLKQVKDFTLTETMLCGKIDDAILTNMFCSEDLCCNLAIIAITLSLHSVLNF